MARPFHFNLEKILEYRRQMEDQAKLALSRARQDETRQMERIRILQEDMQSCLLHLGQAKQMTQAELWLWSGWRTCLEVDKAQAQASLARLREQTETCRCELVNRAKDRNLLEKLKNKQAEKHAQAESHKEQSEFDDTATFRHGRTLYQTGTGSCSFGGRQTGGD